MEELVFLSAESVTYRAEPPMILSIVLIREVQCQIAGCFLATGDAPRQSA